MKLNTNINCVVIAFWYVHFNNRIGNFNDNLMDLHLHKSQLKSVANLLSGNTVSHFKMH